MKADVGVPCSRVHAVLAKVLAHILWCRLRQQSIDTFPETQRSRACFQTQIPFILAFIPLVMSQDETLETSCKLLARKTLLLPRKHAAYCIQVEKCFITVNYPAVCSKITEQEENEHHTKWRPAGTWAVYCSVWRHNHCQPHHKFCITLDVFGITSVLLIIFTVCQKFKYSDTNQIKMQNNCIYFHYHMSNLACENNNHVSESLIIAYCILCTIF